MKNDAEWEIFHSAWDLLKFKQRVINMLKQSQLVVEDSQLVVCGRQTAEGDVSCEPVRLLPAKIKWYSMRHLLIKTDTEFTPTASMSISQCSKNSGDLVFISIILIIKGDTMCAQSWPPSHPGSGDDDINNNWGETWAGGEEAARNVWPSVNNWTRASGKNRAWTSLSWSDTL